MRLICLQLCPSDLNTKILSKKSMVNLGFMSFFTKACCVALSEWPAVNAMIDGDEIVYNENCDISIAVSTPKGLVVPDKESRFNGF